MDPQPQIPNQNPSPDAGPKAMPSANNPLARPEKYDELANQPAVYNVMPQARGGNDLVQPKILQQPEQTTAPAAAGVAAGNTGKTPGTTAPPKAAASGFLGRLIAYKFYVIMAIVL